MRGFHVGLLGAGEEEALVEFAQMRGDLLPKRPLLAFFRLLSFGRDVVLEPAAVPVNVENHVKIVVNSVLDDLLNPVWPVEVDFGSVRIGVLIP